MLTKLLNVSRVRVEIESEKQLLKSESLPIKSTDQTKS